MSITDELRNWASIQVHEIVTPMSGRAERELLAIADRIDEQHRRALERVAAMVDEPDELDRLDKRIKALEHLADGMLLDESELRERVSAIERKLNHKGAE